jgi:hypothetical protein
MASPGWGGALGKFVEGYMKGTATATAQRQQRVDGLMDMAHKFAERADTEPDENMAKFFTDQSRQMLDEATKIQTEKIGTWHVLSKLFGGGKGNKKLNSMAPSIMSATAGKPQGEETPQQIPVQQTPQTMQQAEEAFKGWTPAPGEMIPQQAPGAPGGGEPPMTRFPTATPAPANVSLPTATPAPRNISQATPAAIQSQTAAGIPRNIGGVPISREEQRAMAKSEFLAGRQEERQLSLSEKQAHIAMQHNQEMATWQAEQTDRYSFQRADKWTKTGPAQELSKRDPQLYQDTIQFLQFGTPIRDRSYQLREIDKQDPVTGKRSRQLYSIDARSGTVTAKIGEPEQIPDNPHDLEVKPYMTEGKSYADAEGAWAKDQMSENRLSAQIKRLQAERGAEMVTAQQQLNKLRQQKIEGKVDAAWAKQVLSIARPLAFQSGYQRDTSGMIVGWDVSDAMAALVQIVQFWGGMSWPELQKVLGASEDQKSMDEDNATWFLNQHRNQGQTPTPGVVGATGGRGAPPPTGTPLKLPGVSR